MLKLNQIKEGGKAFVYLVPFFLTLAVFITYHPVLHGQFLWDDSFLVTGNPLIKSPILGLEVFRHFLFTDAKGEFYRPVQNLSYILDYWRAGLSAPAFHQTNLFIHTLNGCLVFFIAKRLLLLLGKTSEIKSLGLAFAVAIFWLLHPVHSAIVAYVSGRADSLALAGMLGAWLCWEKAIDAQTKTKRCAGLFLAALLALTGCCSKEISMAGLGLFLFYLWLLRTDLSGEPKVKTTLGVIAVFSSYLLLRQLPAPNIAPSGADLVSWPQKMELFFRAIGDYARLFLYPGKLFMERQVSIPTGLFTDPVKNDPLFPYLGWVGAATLAILCVSLFWKGEGNRLRMLGVLWFFIMILPVSNFFPLNATVAEHWLYIPSIGLCLWLVGCWMDGGRILQRIGIVIFPIFLVMLASRTYERAKDWQNPVTFYHANIINGGDSVRIRMNLAAEYQKIGRLPEAERIYQSIICVLPNFPLAKIALSRNLKLQKRTIKSGAEENQSGWQGTTERVAMIDQLTQSEKISEALKMARQSYELNPNSWPIAKALSKIYIEQKQPHVSLELLRGFVARNWWHAESQNQLGELYVSLGQPQEAIATYLLASRLDIRNAEPLNQAALLLAQNGKYSQAIILQKTAIHRNDTPRQREILSIIQSIDNKNHVK